MGSDIQVLLFGDQSGEVIPELRELVNVKDNPLLVSYFERAYMVLRDEVSYNPQDTRGIPNFVSIDNLLWRYAESPIKNPALESSLVCIHQAATLLRTFGDGTVLFPKSDNTRLVGSCTGLLTASAVSCSRTWIEFLSVAVEILRIAFRTGIQVTKVCDELKQKTDKSESWSAIFPGVNEKQAQKSLNEYFKATISSPTGRPFISAVSANSVTISAPPVELDQLISSNVMKSTRPIRLPIYGPYHSPQFYNDTTINTILECLEGTAHESWAPRVPIIANNDTEIYIADSFQSLLEAVLEDILLKRLNWDQVSNNCVSSVSSLEPNKCIVSSFGGRNAGNSLGNTLAQAQKFEVAVQQRQPLSPGNEKTGHLRSSKIAIVGMAGRFPDASSTDAFWEVLKKGLDVHMEIPKDRFDIKTHYDPTGKKKNTSHSPYGCFCEDPGMFDARFFNMSPKEATQTDPMHRMALLTAYEAMEMSGYVPNRTPSTMLDRIGTFYGQTSDDWREIQDGQNVSTYFIPGGVRAFGPGRINYFFKFAGPSFSVDTACSSSLAAINIACNSLWQGDCDMALAGGMNIMTNSDIFAGLSRGQFLSKTGNCKTFDDGADGYCRGEGVGSVVLKRIEDAIADKDPILAVILNAGTNHSAEAISITHPHAGAQKFLFKTILSEAGLKPQDISYVEMHGTGTQAGDAIEMESVLGSFAPEGLNRKHDQPLYLGSVKSNVGHGEAASGITALVKILLMLDNNAIPPHAGIKTTINHNFPDLAARNVHISQGRSTPWLRPEGGKRRFVLNNFSAAGGNTTLVMEDGPERIGDGSGDPRSTHVIGCTGKTQKAMVRNCEMLVKYLEENPDTDLPSLSYTSTARRIQYAYRTMAAGSDLQTIAAGLKKAAQVDHTPVQPLQVIFAFTGQGSHYTAMGKTFYDQIATFKADIDRYDLLAQSQGFPSILPLIEGSVEIETLSPVVVQLGAICIQMALVNLWAFWGVKPVGVIGHSLGEYAALYAAGVLSVNDTIYLTGTRAQLLEQNCSMGTHSMLAVSASTEDLKDVIDGTTYEIACINGPSATVISGKIEDIASLKEDLGSKGVRCTELKVPFAFHSSQLDPALEAFEAAAAGANYQAPDIPVISPLLSKVIREKGTIDAAYLTRHARRCVNFAGAVEAAESEGLVYSTSVVIEIGSHPLCSGMMKSVLGPKITAVPSLRRGEDTWKVVANSVSTVFMAGVEINWNHYHEDFPDSHWCLRLGSYGWDATKYWIEYTNNWLLTKGEDPEVIAENERKRKAQSLNTSAVQRIVEEDFKIETQSGNIITETNIGRADMDEAIKGHTVNGNLLASSALYCDMAFTIGDYIHRQLKPDDDEFGLDCTNMVIEKPLKPHGGEQLLRASAKVDLTQNLCMMTFYSVDKDGKTTIEHGHCQVEFGDTNKWTREFSRQKYLINSQIDRLLKGAKEGTYNQLTKKMAYKLFSSIITYEDAYKTMNEVTLNGPETEAVAKIDLHPVKDSSFYMAPYHIDGLCHLAGFVMNANDDIDSSQNAYINHGWDSVKFIEKPDPEKDYMSYVRMQPVSEDSKDFSGDVFVFDSLGNIIGCIAGLEFQHLPKKVLDHVMPPPGGAKSKAAAPAAKAAPAPKKKAEKTKAAPKKAAPAPSGGATKAFAIMAEEIGVPVEDLTDDSDLSGLGVDSLMSLTISGKFREELDLEVPSTLFVDCSTMGEIKAWMNKNAGGSEAAPAADSSTAESSEDVDGDATPNEDEDDSATSADEVDDDEGPPKQEGGAKSDAIATIKAAIAEETGVSPDEVTASSELANMGIDSLMSLQILGMLREDHGMELPATFFSDHQTFGDIEKALGGGSKSEEAPKEEKKAKSKSKSKPKEPEPEPASKEVEETAPTKASRKTSPPAPSQISKADTAGKKKNQATSVLLQGSMKTATKKLFLFPDGSGSATSYSTIPALGDKEFALVAMSCPYMKTPDAWNDGIPGVASLYIEEIRRRQPEGPYLLGGWSAGGIVAYEAALQLQDAGEKVEKLIFLDVPCPLPPQALPPRLHEFFDEIGLLGAEGEAPAWLVPHFGATVRALSSYVPRTMDPSKENIPKTFTIYAKDGVCKNDDDPRPELTPEDPPHMNWLLFNRTDFSGMGWENIFNSKDNIVSLDPIEGVNHFTMMRDPGVGQIPARLKQALDLN